MLHIGLTFAEAGIGSSVQQKFDKVIIGYIDSIHQRSPSKANPGLHIHACPQQKDPIKSGNEVIT